MLQFGKISTIVLCLIVPSSALQAKSVKPASGKDYRFSGEFVDRIGGSELPMCERPFLARHPEFSEAATQVRQSVVRVRCDKQGRYDTSGVYIDTPSKRLVFTVEHAISAYRYNNAKYKITHVSRPAKCVVFDPTTGESVGLDPAIPARFGHPPDKVSLDATEDWLLLPLVKPLKLPPLPLATAPGRKGETLLLVGQLGLLERGKPCANFTTCVIKDIKTTFRDEKSRPPYYATNCSSVSGDSGGALAISDGNGKQKLAAILTGSTIDLPPGSPWDEEKMNTAGIGVGGPLLQAMYELEISLRDAGTTKR